ncbi:hypothetical protein ACFX13_027554 [Malus domestica]
MLCGPMIETASSFSSPSVRNSSGLPHRKTKHRSSSKVPQPTFSILSWFFPENQPNSQQISQKPELLI